MGKRLQERTKDEKKQWHVVNHLTSVFGTSFYISLLQLMYDQSPLHLSCYGSQQKHKGAQKRPSEQCKRPSITRGPQEQRWFHSKLLTEGKMSFSSGLFSSNTNHSVYQILDCGVFFVLFLSFFFYCLLAHQCFCMNVSRPADVKPSVSLPQVRGNSIRMDKSDMSQVKDD